jgi:DNA-binding FadR family transcriptional regulator
MSEHERIFLAIQAADAAGARSWMVEHLQRGESSILRATKMACPPVEAAQATV